MGLRLKFNLMLLAVAMVGALAFSVVSIPISRSLAMSEVLQASRIMMESAAGARDYTSAQIAPLLAPDMGNRFHPQAVSAYAAKATFADLHAHFPNYGYREAALNPTNPEDRASDWEADIIADFRDHPKKAEAVVTRETAMGPMLYLARPLVAAPACLTCHSTASAAPASMVAIYGSRNGFGWQEGETIGAQIVSVPMTVPLAWAAHVRWLFLAIYGGVFLLLFALLNLLLGLTVIGPVDAMARTAEAVSLGQLDAPEYIRRGGDQIARLSVAINRLRRSLREAMRLIE